MPKMRKLLFSQAIVKRETQLTFCKPQQNSLLKDKNVALLTRKRLSEGAQPKHRRTACTAVRNLDWLKLSKCGENYVFAFFWSLEQYFLIFKLI